MEGRVYSRAEGLDVMLKIRERKMTFVFGTWATERRVLCPEMVSMGEEAILLLSKSSSGSLLASPVGVLVMYVLCKMENCNFHMNENRILSFEQNHMKCFWIDFYGSFKYENTSWMLCFDSNTPAPLHSLPIGSHRSEEN